jgi:hypothetical protein
MANSLGVFRDSRDHSLASFAERISPGTGSHTLAEVDRLYPRILQHHSRQATLHTDCLRMQVHTPSRNPIKREPRT